MNHLPPTVKPAGWLETGNIALRVAKRSADVVALTLLLAFGLTYLVLALRLPFDSLPSPSTGLFPRIIAVLIIVSAALSLFFRLVRHRLASAVLDEDEGAEEREFGEAFGRVPALAACLVLYVISAPRVGHIISSSLVTLLVLLMLANRPRWQMAAISVAFGIGSYALFHILLERPLPTGSWLL